MNNSTLSFISKFFTFFEKNIYNKGEKESVLFNLLAECFSEFFKATPRASMFQNAFQIFQKFFIACYEFCSEKDLIGVRDK